MPGFDEAQFGSAITQLHALATGVGVLHYDHYYDTLAAKTNLRFASVWLARRGSL
jgi:hypothetical protein